MKFRFLQLLGITSACLVVMGATAQTAAQTDMANTLRTQRLLIKEAAPVKSLSDFYFQIQSNSRGATAFRKLSAQQQQEFIAGLRFGSEGLSSIRLGVLEESLTVSAAHDILSLFGFQHMIQQMPGLKVVSKNDLMLKSGYQSQRSVIGAEGDGGGDFLKGYYCAGRATCTESTRDACTSNC